MKFRFGIAAIVVAAMAVVAGCGSSSSSSSSESSSNLPSSIGKLEGALNLIAWQGYTEPDVVKPFEQQTGCQVHVTYGETSDDMVQKMRTGNYDGVSASGDATL